MAHDVTELNVSTGETTTREYTQSERDAIVAMQPTTEQKWVRVRTKRNVLLHETDWWALGDLSISDAQTAYRKALRDLPASESNPDDIVYPSKP